MLMLIKDLIEEDFVNYKLPSMYIIFPKCNWKCDREAGCAICQNSALAHEPDIEIASIELVSRYLRNPITKAIVMAGLEPFDTPQETLELIAEFRKYTDDDIVLYTGYKEEELDLNEIKQFKNIIIKFGRFIPNQESRYDEILGVKLASPNQYARRIS